nr:immunoglobulin heavy chain junction region [Macaca mulatta]MOV39004.1 immunoglobulin heavy chain junction region [Macaca mulatta]MOV39900.1 immunoglobulin heavy chain junction region [Macaca mulatta]MOV41575.1 immunoglobulin heavy chain junction region [Macaca mulatta]MOV41685.1 immunoglobulin heavy chain junction region [Macaca mulatta]
CARDWALTAYNRFDVW